MTRTSAASRRFPFALALASLPLLALVAIAPGCGGGVSASELCQKACDCQGSCPDSALDECVTQLERAQETADDVGCGSEYDDYLGCIDELLDTCSTDIEDSCGAEARDLQSCASGSSSGADDTTSPGDPGGSDADACAELYLAVRDCPDYEVSEPTEACSAQDLQIAQCMLDYGGDLCDASVLQEASAACQPD
jgi:hypothetical protein